MILILKIRGIKRIHELLEILKWIEDSNIPYHTELEVSPVENVILVREAPKKKAKIEKENE